MKNTAMPWMIYRRMPLVFAICAALYARDMRKVIQQYIEREIKAIVEKMEHLRSKREKTKAEDGAKNYMKTLQQEEIDGRANTPWGISDIACTAVQQGHRKERKNRLCFFLSRFTLFGQACALPCEGGTCHLRHT